MITDEALEWAAQLWCRPENSHRQMDPLFVESIAVAVKELMAERDNWIDTARFYAKNSDYWQARADDACRLLKYAGDNWWGQLMREVARET